MNYTDRLKRDLLLYGNCYEVMFKPNWFQRIYRRLIKLPIDRKRIDPMKIKIGTNTNTFGELTKRYIKSMAKKLDKDILG